MDAKNPANARERADLVVDLTLYLGACESLFDEQSRGQRPGREGLHAAAIELEERARGFRFIGLANCLARCAGFLEAAGPLNAAALRRALEQLAGLVGQTREGLSLPDRAKVEEALGRIALEERTDVPAPSVDARAKLQPANRFPGRAEPPATGPVEARVEQTAPRAPALPSLPHVAAQEARPAAQASPRAPALPQGGPPGSPMPQVSPSGPALPRMVTLYTPRKAAEGGVQASAPAPAGGSDLGKTLTIGLAAAPPIARSPTPQPALAQPGLPAPITPLAADRPLPPVSPPGGTDQGKLAPSPRLKSRAPTLFGLRAFGQNRAAPQLSAEPAARQSAGPSPLGLRPGTPLPSRPDRGRWSPSSLAPLTDASGNDSPALPEAPLGSTWMRRALGRLGKHTGRESRRSRVDEAEPQRPRPPALGRVSSRDWLLGGAAGMAVGTLAVAFVVLWDRVHQPHDGGQLVVEPPAASSGPVPAEEQRRPPITADPARVDPERELLVLRDKTHARGAVESPELKAWVDEQAALQARLLETGQCEGSAAACAALFKARGEMAPRTGELPPPKKAPKAAGEPRKRWLAGLRMPADFPVDDDDRVRVFFEKYTDTQTGRASFESMLFHCGKYRDLIQATLIRYDLPPSLLAMVFAESGCNPTAQSAVGAEGLWQFMPESARAYHLHIIEGVVDERHSPPKSTEAAIHFLADLYKKFGSWDLVFAAYNMGPYGLAARMQRAGRDDVGFWELLDADLLPSETSNYVPIIEAFALILENLIRLKFVGVQMAPPEVTADLDVAPGTRLSLIARAASTSVKQLQQWNLDLKSDIVPDIPGELFPARVPKDVVVQAHEQLQALLESGAAEDRCVSASFDWGSQRLAPAQLAEICRKTTGMAPPAASSTP